MEKDEKKEDQLEQVIPKLRSMLNSMKYGSITLVIQDGKVIQLEKNEKLRLK
ncbi:YezD family protein [Peribacillus tepidiphilus]|uniref:YezD family protein n=1 Tax=Peribacillus tepidiphilus TaxID=2652445 RepID=UPI0012916D80|nr:YezD family protein [Peribacillus tepidiphilus]